MDGDTLREMNGPHKAPHHVKPREIPVETIEGLGSIGCTPDEICAFLRISRSTYEFYKNDPVFKDALERGAAVGRISLRRMQWHSAKSGSVAMQIFLGKVYLGQRETSVHEVREITAQEKAREIRETLAQIATVDAVEPDGPVTTLTITG